MPFPSYLRHDFYDWEFRLSKRYSDSLRDIRNSLITTNTLWRKAGQTVR